jgi:hypothetical protein
MSYPLVFVSYSWDTREHQKWVREVLTNGLRRRGVDAQIDQHNLRYGDPTDRFMEEFIPRADHVVVVCTPGYYAKAASDEGGVGYEKQLIKRYIAIHRQSRRVVPVLRDGEPATSIPPFLGSRLYVDLRSDDDADVMLDDLAAVLIDRPLLEAPPVQAP